jgi:hypothetical protein
MMVKVIHNFLSYPHKTDVERPSSGDVNLKMAFLRMAWSHFKLQPDSSEVNSIRGTTV